MSFDREIDHGVQQRVPRCELNRIRHHLGEFFTWCADYTHIPELLTLAQTIDRWRDPLITALLTGCPTPKAKASTE